MLNISLRGSTRPISGTCGDAADMLLQRKNAPIHGETGCLLSFGSLSELVGQLTVAFDSDPPIRQGRSKGEALVGQENEVFGIAAESDVGGSGLGRLHASLTFLYNDIVSTGHCPGQLESVADGTGYLRPRIEKPSDNESRNRVDYGR